MRQIGESHLYSVCSVTHGNRRELIEENILSVANQNRDDEFEFEHVIVDNASTDDTAEYLRDAAQPKYPHLKVMYLREPLPLGAARNFAYYAATHHVDGSRRNDVDYIVPLDGDDYLLPPALTAFSAIAHQYNTYEQLAAAREHIDKRLWGDYARSRELPEMMIGIPMVVDGQRRPIDHPTLDFNNHAYSYQAEDFLELMYRENRLAVGTVAVAPEAIRRAGKWDESRLLHAEDWSLWLNVLATVRSYHCDVSRYISAYRIHDAQSSQQPGIEREWTIDGHMLRRQLIARFAGRSSMQVIEALGEELFTEDYLGLGAGDFIAALYRRDERGRYRAWRTRA